MSSCWRVTPTLYCLSHNSRSRNRGPTSNRTGKPAQTRVAPAANLGMPAPLHVRAFIGFGAMLIIAAAGSNRFYWLVVTDAQSWSRRGPTRKRLVGAAHTRVLGQGAPPCSGECKHSGGRASEEPLAFRPASDGCAHPILFEVTAFSARTETEARAARAPPYANGLPAKAAMEAQADRASPSLRGLSRARTSGIRRSGLPRVAKRARGLFLLPHARARTKFGDCVYPGHGTWLIR